MDFVFTTRLRRFVPLLLAVVAACLAFGSTIFAANIGTVVPIVGQISDLAYDATRNLVYLANPSRNEVDIYSVDSKKLTGSVITGIQPWNGLMVVRHEDEEIPLGLAAAQKIWVRRALD